MTAADWKQETLAYYEANTDDFITGTLAADMQATRDRFAALLSPRALILDFGCGSGRDTKAFLEAGYRVEAVDGSEELCRKASAYTGIPVKKMFFQELDAVERYDGIWACASILHLPKKELAEVIGKIAAALKPNGVLYTSFKYGEFEGMRKGRYFTDFTEETLKAFWTSFPSLPIVELWITEDVRPDRKEEKWINLLARHMQHSAQHIPTGRGSISCMNNTGGITSTPSGRGRNCTGLGTRKKNSTRS